MATDPFIHLHLHTEYSILDGAVRIKDLMKKAQRAKMPAVAMTDHGNIFGAIDFFKTAKKSGIKPIIGCEAYLTPPGTRMTEQNPTIMATGGKMKRSLNSHITLLASTNKGYANLVKLVSMGHLKGHSDEPRIDKELLAEYSEGIICLSGCVNGEINQAIQADDIERARQSVGEFKDIFEPGSFFLEMHDHGLASQQKCNNQLIKFSKQLDIPLVAANDVHFLNKADHDAHDVMICIGEGALQMDENRVRYSPEVYFKSTAEMRALFKETPEAIRNTLEIADRCNVEIHLDATSSAKYPQFESPDGSPREAYFRKVCFDGLRERYGDRAGTDPELRTRLDYEIGVMENMGFVSYFLITWDFVKWAKDNEIPVGPGRGSAAGSIVAYVLGITDLCPIRFGLIFERFLNPERVSPPDIDIDFCQTRRPEVIEYVRRKYGEEAVSHIITFGTMGAKSVVRDVGRVMALSYSEGDRIAKMIPAEIGVTLADAKKKNPELRDEIENNQTIAELWKYSTFLEGLNRGVGVHAAGVVIGDCDLTEHMPLARAKEGEIVSQFAMKPLTDIGMLKMDFLGLKTLTVIQDAVDHIHVHTPDFKVDDIPLDNQKAFELLSRGETTGVFQLESGGMMNLCKQFDVDRIEDIIALIALYRPGPMDLIPDFIKRKKGETKVTYLHPLLEEASEETYGILIYQEQVQRAANLLGGYSLGDADLLRRAMGKKDENEMKEQRKIFVAGCKRVNNIPEQKANDIFDLLEKFAGYGFNKSHSAAYGLITYQTAYLKANYPVEFMSGLLSNEINNTDKISIFVAECQRMGFPILAPDVNHSLMKFAPEDTDAGSRTAIRYGLAAVKNVGAAAMDTTVKERIATGKIYDSMEEFSTRLDSKVVNKKILENLVKAGAFDFTGERRDVLFTRISRVIASSNSVQKDKNSGQESLFDLTEMAASAPEPTVYDDEEKIVWDKKEYLSHEKDLLGFYVTGHPLDEYRAAIEAGNYNPIGGLEAMKPGGKPQIFAGLINAVAVKYTKREGKPFAILSLEDFTGQTEVMVWNETYNKRITLLEKGKVIKLKAKVEEDSFSEQNRLTAEDMLPLEPIDGPANDAPPSITNGTNNAPASNEPTGSGHQTTPIASSQPPTSTPPAHHNVPPVVLLLDSVRDTNSAIDFISETARKFPGSRPLQLRVTLASGKNVVLEADNSFQVSDDFEKAQGLGMWVTPSA